MANQHRAWTHEEDSRLEFMWRRNIMLKVICEDIGRSQASVLQRCRKLGLPKRQKGNLKRRFNLDVSPELYQALRRRASERQTSASGYVRYLIQRDIGQAI